MIRPPRTQPLNNGPELTPLIDIVFIVVVFLLLTANVQVMSLPVDIPSSDSQLPTATAEENMFTVAIKAMPPHWVINVEGSGTSHYEDWLDFKGALIDQLRQQPTKLLIAPEPNASAEHLLKLLALLNEEAFGNAHILMENES